jgi:antitoxin MazE
MRAFIDKWGDSLAVRLPKDAVEAAGLSEGMALDLTIEDDALVLRPHRWDIRTLVAQIKGDPPPLEWDDVPRGCELG